MEAENCESSVDKVSHAKKICLNLQSPDKRIRKQALFDLQKFLSDKNNRICDEELHSIFIETQAYTLNVLRDKIEAVREQGVNLIYFFVIDVLPVNDFYLTYIFPVIVERIGTVELIEESEEIRLKVVQLMQAIILKYSNTEQVKPFLNDCVIVLSETVKDKFPEIKELSCKCILDLAKALPQDFHLQAGSLVKPVITCFGHQRYKVRMAAITTIGEIIMHTTDNSINDVVIPMAERLFDQTPVIRLTVAQVAARWLLEYRDRYSYFQKILPLLLTCLNDEVPDIRTEAYKLWERVGIQYLKENEKDLKDQLDFLLETPKHYPKSYPNLGCRVLVQRNIGRLVGAISFELTSWQEDIRFRTSQLLCSLVLYAEEGVTQHLQDILPAMYTAARDFDQRIVENIDRSCELLGNFVPIKSWSKLVLPIFEDEVHNGHLSVLSGLIRGTPQEYAVHLLEEISEILANEHICFTRKKMHQTQLLRCIRAVMEKYEPEKSDSEVGFNLFYCLVALISLKHQENCDINNALLDDLRETLSAPNKYDLWSLFLGRLLDRINVNPKSWTEVTPQRCIFEMVLLESGEAFGEHLQTIGAVLSEALHVDSDAECRLKTLSALASAFENKNLIFQRSTNLTQFFDGLITDVFVPSLVWHAGLTAEALRTISAYCLLCALVPSSKIALFPNDEVLRKLYDKLAPLLISLLEDASPQSRQFATECLSRLTEHAAIRSIFTADDLIAIYPELLKRLDDPTDKVRNTALQMLPEILGRAPDKFKEPHYRAHHELIIETLLTHFDDDDEEVRKMVLDALKVLSAINVNELDQKISKHRPLLQNQDGCDAVMEHLQEISLQENS